MPDRPAGPWQAPWGQAGPEPVPKPGMIGTWPGEYKTVGRRAEPRRGGPALWCVRPGAAVFLSKTPESFPKTPREMSIHTTGGPRAEGMPGTVVHEPKAHPRRMKMGPVPPSSMLHRLRVRPGAPLAGRNPGAFRQTAEPQRQVRRGGLGEGAPPFGGTPGRERDYHGAQGGRTCQSPFSRQGFEDDDAGRRAGTGEKRAEKCTKSAHLVGHS